MPNFTAGTSFTDGVTNDVTALKLNALVADAVPTSSLALASTTGTISNFTASTANITLGTIPTLTAGTTTSTNAVVTNGTITNLSATTSTFLGTITGSTNVVNIGSGQIYKDASGRVGIGTASPDASYRMTVSGSRSAVVPGIIFTDSDATPTNYSLYVNGSKSFTIFDATAGVNRLLVDSSGNVGVGTASPTAKLDVRAADAAGQMQLTATTGTNAAYANFQNSGGAFIVGKDNSVGGNLIGAPYSSCLYSQGPYPMVFCTDSVERLRIDSSGNVGIGQSSLTSTLTVNKAGADTTIQMQEGGVNTAQITSYQSSMYLTVAGANNIIFRPNSIERMRITSGGEVYIAGTTDQGAYNLQVNGTGVWGAGAYVNGSDSRIKEDIQPLASGLDVVKKLNPVTYKYKETWSSDQSIQSGFIAQELLTALDGQIYVDGVVQQGGTEGYYSVAYQNLIPVLAKAIQELKIENDSLKSRIEALETA
jgi:hypothetical protein